MKKITLVLTLSLLISLGGFLTGCNQERAIAAASAGAVELTDALTGYEFETQTYRSGTVVINYPQLISLTDNELQNSINERLRESALSNYLAGDTKELTYELDYEVMFSGSDLISIRYTGYSYMQGAAHPNTFLFTYNLDVKTQRRLQLKDLFTVSEGFVAAVRGGTICSDKHELSPEYLELVENYLNEYNTAAWMTHLTNSDTDGSENDLAVYSYLTGDSLVVSIFIPHYMGDYIELAVSCEDLEDYKTAHTIWDTL